ncbi:hypothetical protein ACHQM5_028348 [Ranunculus cassubicifolius]
MTAGIRRSDRRARRPATPLPATPRERESQLLGLGVNVPTRKAVCMSRNNEKEMDAATKRMKREIDKMFKKSILGGMPRAGKTVYIVAERYIGLSRHYSRAFLTAIYIVDRMAAESDAKTLYKAGEKRLGTDEKTFNIIFSSRSSAHMAAVSASYYQMHGNSLEKAIKKETSGAYEFALLTILRCAESAPKYFAKALHKAMKGMGTNDSALVRIVVTRTEIDMQYIKLEYQKKYKKTLYDAIKSETSGNYRNFLLSLVGAH